MTAVRSWGAGSPSGSLTDEFWAAAARGVLVRPVCEACGRSFFTPRVVCPNCRSARWRYSESSGRGVVYSHTTIHRGPDPGWEVPYVLAIVDMEEGWSLMTRLLVDPPDESMPGALIGAPVSVEFIDAHAPDTRRLPAFRFGPGDAVPGGAVAEETAGARAVDPMLRRPAVRP